MGYIIAGSNLANLDRPVVTETVETVFDVLVLATRLQNDGYQVRIATSEGDEVPLEELKVRAGVGGRSS